jgi:uncharacterized membrane protein
MRNWDIAFTGAWPAWAVFLLGAGAVALAWAFYRRKRETLRPALYWTLLGLRVAAIAAVALFLMKPVVRFSHAREELRVIAVLVDVSQSMTIRDAFEGRSRLDTALMLLREEPHGLLKKLAQGRQVRFFAFGASAVEAQPGDALLANQKTTAIGDALKEVVARCGQQGLAGIVLLSDGVSTSGEDARQAARGLGVPVYPVALGGKRVEKGKFFDIGIAGAPHNVELIVNNTAKLKLRLSNYGLENFSEADRLVELKVSKGEQALKSEPRQIQFPKGNGTRDVTAEFVPAETGIYRLLLSLPVIPGETITENNSREVAVRVIDPKLRVLIVEGVARSEYRFLRHVLASDPSVELTSVVKLRKDLFLLQGAETGIDLSHGLPVKREDAGKFDVVILGDIAREEFSDEQLTVLKQFVSDGGGLLTMGGYRAYGAGGYAGSALEDLLPVTMGGPGDGQCEGGFAPQMTPLARTHPVFDGCARFFGAGADAAQLDGANRVRGVKPSAETLLVHPAEKAGPAPMPVAAAQSYGKGRVLALMADTTWKWKFQNEGRGLDSPYYRFWRQSVRWLAGRKDSPDSGKEMLAAWPNKIEYDPGETVSVEARVRDKDGQPREDAVVEMRIRPPAAAVKGAPEKEKGTPKEPDAAVRFERIPLSLGQYQGAFRPPAGGIYRAQVRASDKNGEIATTEFEFIVGRAAGEFDSVDIDELLLKGLASDTGGQYHIVTTAQRIPEELNARQRRVQYTDEKDIWNSPWFFLAFLGFVTAEWVLRKRNGLN